MMTIQKTHRSAWALFALGCLFTQPAFAQNAREAQEERVRLDEIARVAAQQFTQARTELDQTRPTVPEASVGGQVSLTLDDATTRALERNLELAVERLNPQTFDLQIARLNGLYRPVATSQIGQRSLTQPPTNQLNGGTIVTNDTTTYNAGIAQQLPSFL